MNKPNRAWFMRKIKESPYGSMRQLCRRIIQPNGEPMDTGNFSKKLTGEVKLTLNEIRQFADLLHVSVIDVLKHAGLEFYDWDFKEMK